MVTSLSSLPVIEPPGQCSHKLPPRSCRRHPKSCAVPHEHGKWIWLGREQMMLGACSMTLLHRCVRWGWSSSVFVCLLYLPHHLMTILSFLYFTITHAQSHTHTHTHTHTHYTPAVAVSGTPLSFWAQSLMCAFSSSVFCWTKTSSCWRFSASFIQELRGKLLSGKEKSESGAAEAL